MSCGSGPASSAPATGRISLIWVSPISALPSPTISAPRPNLILAFTASAMPSRSQQALQIDAGQAAIAVGDGLRVEQRLLEGLRSWRGRASPRPCGSRRPCPSGRCRRGSLRELAALDELVGGLDAEDGDVERLPLLDLGLQRAGRAVFDLELVAGRLLELRAKLLQHRFQRVRAQQRDAAAAPRWLAPVTPASSARIRQRGQPEKSASWRNFLPSIGRPDVAVPAVSVPA